MDLGFEISLDDASILSESDMVREFPIGSKIYNFEGKVAGAVIGHTAGSSEHQIFFRGGLNLSDVNNTFPIYTSPPSAVFNNNSKSNRIIMELIFREKGESLITGD